MQGYTVDPQSELVEKQFALIYAPRRHRDRFPENCVQIMQTEQEAIDGEDESQKKYAAIVIGPARSSEGFRLYYLVQWLVEDNH